VACKEEEGKKTHIHQAKARRRFLALGGIASGKSPRRTSRVDKKATLHLKRFESVCAPPQQDINVHLAGSDQQGVRIARRDDGVAMGESDAQTTVSHNFGQREIGRVDIVVSLDEL
jgi:hypothetical protein